MIKHSENKHFSTLTADSGKIRDARTSSVIRKGNGAKHLPLHTKPTPSLTNSKCGIYHEKHAGKVVVVPDAWSLAKFALVISTYTLTASYLEKEDIVKIVKQMRFCINRKCVTNIRSIFNNIRPLKNMTVRKDPLLGRLTDEEKANIQVEGFTVQGIPPIDFD